MNEAPPLTSIVQAEANADSRTIDHGSAAVESRPARFPAGTGERSKHVVREMIAAGATSTIYDSRSRDRSPKLARPPAGTPRQVGRVPQAHPDGRMRLEPVVPAASTLQPSHCVDREILAVFDSPPELGETIEAQHRRKERLLGELFARLSVIEARALHGRLSNPGNHDPIATRFARLIPERRTRLLVFLADARRREAIRLACR